MDWTAISAIAAVLALLLGWYLGTRRSKARVYALAPSPAPSQECRVVVENQSDSPVHITRATIIWPVSFRLAEQRYAGGDHEWTVGSELPLDWQRSISTSLTVEPGKSGVWDFRVKSTLRDMRISCIMSFHVDETRWMQISKIRVVKVVQHAVANGSQAIPFIG